MMRIAVPTASAPGRMLREGRVSNSQPWCCEKEAGTARPPQPSLCVSILATWIQINSVSHQCSDAWRARGALTREGVLRCVDQTLLCSRAS